MTVIVRIHTSRAAPWPRNGISKPDQYTWLVPSRSHPGEIHTVAWHHDEKRGVWFSCSCPAGRRSKSMAGDWKSRTDVERPCRHVVAVAEAERSDGYRALSQGIVADAGARFCD